MSTISQYTATVMVLEYQRYVLLETSSETTVTVTGHGLNTDDFIVNVSKRATTNLQAERGSRKITVVDEDTFTLNTPISGQESGNVMYLYSFIDRTNKVLDGTIKLNLKAGGQSDASFKIETDIA